MINIKLLIGSIIAVAILIGVSFTSVVGFQSVKSNVKASPLFTVRTKRAIDEESKELNFDYIGMGKKSIIQIPKRDGSTGLLNKAIDILSNLNDKEFSQLITSVSKYFSQGKSVKDDDIKELTKVLCLLRNNAEIDYVLTDVEGKNIYRIYETRLTTTGFWNLFLYILMYITDFAWLLFIVFLTCFGFETFCVSTCISECRL
ncbi:MAG: hypothetical protein JSW60_00955 [Thermoplasmatales archaeon]|nr:MAG: hypothetical protein JSW60_00955 [Thermoplasmatales archaeon]